MKCWVQSRFAECTTVFGCVVETDDVSELEIELRGRDVDADSRNREGEYVLMLKLCVKDSWRTQNASQYAGSLA